jgi:hypothetical protein
MITNPGYFRRVEDIVGTGRSLAFAWRETEKEFHRAFGLRRFVTYRTFYGAWINHRKGIYPRFVLLHEVRVNLK